MGFAQKYCRREEQKLAANSDPLKITKKLQGKKSPGIFSA